MRYSTTGSSNLKNAQPLVVDCARGQLAIGHNGNLINAAILREAQKIGVKWYFIEDESPSSEYQIPKSLRYLHMVQF